MKALSLTQPWATLVALDAKRYETRSWATHHRGDVAIHAAQGLGLVGGGAGLLQLCKSEPFHAALRPLFEQGEQGGLTYGQLSLPLGAIVAVAELTDCFRCDYGLRFDLERGKLGAEHEAAFGDFAEGRYAWKLANVRPLARPVNCRGALGLWPVPDSVERAVRAGLLS